MKNNLSWDILKKFSSNNKECFSYQDIIKAYPKRNKIYLAKVLSRMVSGGMLIKLGRNLYHIVPTGADAKHYIPDWHLVAKYIMNGRAYYIGYYSAMQIHGLITQPSLKEIIVTNQQVSNSSRYIQGIEFQFVTHTSKRFFGFKNTWVNQYDKVKVSDLEKTIVDAVTRPSLSGGIVEIGKVIFETRKKINLEKLFQYFIQNGSQAAMKRYLFLCELLGIPWTELHKDMSTKTGNGYSLLDTSSADEGIKKSRFGLKINIDTDTIKNAIYT